MLSKLQPNQLRVPLQVVIVVVHMYPIRHFLYYLYMNLFLPLLNIINFHHTVFIYIQGVNE